jgi:D-alanyl-D-alanine carboxypeptidase
MSGAIMRVWLAAAALFSGSLASLAVVSPAVAAPTLLFDANDGKVLYAEDADNQWHPASVTKVMTAYVVFEAIKNGKLKLDDKITCSEKAFLQQPSKVGLPVGGELTVEKGLEALIVKSANDVAVMLAEATGGSEEVFVQRMNETAQRLGMTRTKFVNPNGLPAPDQVTTARDLAKLARAVVKDYPEHAKFWTMSEMRLGKIRLGSHNSLLRTFEGADGLKTGFICDSGFNVIASATRDGRRLMAIVLGSPTSRERTIRAANLLEYGFAAHAWKAALFTPQTVDDLPMAADAKGVVSVRQTVLSFECGTIKPRAVASRRAKAKAKRKAAAEKAEADKKADVAKPSKPVQASTSSAQGTKAQ